MDFEVYCDESRQDLFKSPVAGDNYVLIGGIWIKAEDRSGFKGAIKAIRHKHSVFNEFKWNKVSPSKLGFYIDLVSLFFDRDIRFRVLVLRSDELNAVDFHKADNELMFYKFYYQLLHHWILDENRYRIFLDTKTNRTHNRIGKLDECLRNSNLLSEVNVQALPSHEVDLIQLADLLIGIVSYKFHDRSESNAKHTLVQEIESKLGREIRATSRAEKKFNIFRFKPGGGW